MNALDELNLLLGIGPGKATRLPITLTKSGYSAVKPLGKGGFGQAHLVYHKGLSKYFVVKHINLLQLSTRQRKDAHNEIHILQSLHHPNIVRYCEFCEEQPHLYIMMEYADGGDLAGHLSKLHVSRRRLTEEQLVSLFAQTALAIKYLHDRRILHRDIKSSNVFLTQAHVVKLGDFGISTVLQTTSAMCKTICGTPCYFSPELCQGKSYNSKSDVWSLGVLLYEMATLSLPFEGREMTNLMQTIVSKPAPHLPAGHFSAELDDLCQWMLTKDPAQRPDIVQVLRHPAVVSKMPSVTAQLEQYTSRPSSAATGGPAAMGASALGGGGAAGAAAAFRQAQPVPAPVPASASAPPMRNYNNINNNNVAAAEKQPPVPAPRAQNGANNNNNIPVNTNVGWNKPAQPQQLPPAPPPRAERPRPAEAPQPPPPQQRPSPAPAAVAVAAAVATNEAAANAYAQAQLLVRQNRRDVSPAAAQGAAAAAAAAAVTPAAISPSAPKGGVAQDPQSVPDEEMQRQPQHDRKRKQRQQQEDLARALAQVDIIVQEETAKRTTPPPPPITGAVAQKPAATAPAPIEHAAPENSNKRNYYDDVVHVMLADAVSAPSSVARPSNVANDDNKILKAKIESSSPAVESIERGSESDIVQDHQHHEEVRQQQQQQQQQQGADELAQVIDELRETVMEEDKVAATDSSSSPAPVPPPSQLSPPAPNVFVGVAPPPPPQAPRNQPQQQQQSVAAVVPPSQPLRPITRPVSRSNRWNFTDEKGTTLDVQSLMSNSSFGGGSSNNTSASVAVRNVVASAAAEAAAEDAASASSASPSAQQPAASVASACATSISAPAAAAFVNGACLCGAVNLTVPVCDIIGSFVAGDSLSVRFSSSPAGVEYLHLPDRHEADVRGWIKCSQASAVSPVAFFDHVVGDWKTRMLFCARCASSLAVINLPGAMGSCLPRGNFLQSTLPSDQFTMSP